MGLCLVIFVDTYVTFATRGKWFFGSKLKSMVQGKKHVVQHRL
jgi:hypothetical protein